MANGEKNRQTLTGPSRREGSSMIRRVVKEWKWRGGMEIGGFHRTVIGLGYTIRGGNGRRRPGVTVINSVRTANYKEFWDG